MVIYRAENSSGEYDGGCVCETVPLQTYLTGCRYLATTSVSHTAHATNPFSSYHTAVHPFLAPLTDSTVMHTDMGMDMTASPLLKACCPVSRLRLIAPPRSSRRSLVMEPPCLSNQDKSLPRSAPAPAALLFDASAMSSLLPAAAVVCPLVRRGVLRGALVLGASLGAIVSAKAVKCRPFREVLRLNPLNQKVLSGFLASRSGSRFSILSSWFSLCSLVLCSDVGRVLDVGRYHLR